LGLGELSAKLDAEAFGNDLRDLFDREEGEPALSLLDWDPLEDVYGTQFAHDQGQTEELKLAGINDDPDLEAMISLLA